MSRRRILGRACISIFGVALAALAMSCSVFGGDGSKGAQGAHVRAIALATDLTSDGQPVKPDIVFPASTQKVQAVVVLDGAKPGMKVTGTWFQLGVANVPAEGSQINSSDVVLDSTTAQNGVARVTFIQQAGQRLPEDSWLLRIYVNGELVRTTGFVISAEVGAVASPAPPSQAQPAATSTPRSYTVVAGDTLGGIAQKFLPAGDNVQNYTNLILQLNNLPATTTLVAGQVLRIP